MATVSIDRVKFVVDENLLSLGNGMVATRGDTARFSREPVEELLPRGISDRDWIPIVGDYEWIMITNDGHLRTRPSEAQLAIAHKLKVVHLHGRVGSQKPWDQLVRVATRWSNIVGQQDKPGPWWLSLQSRGSILRSFAPGADA